MPIIKLNENKTLTCKTLSYTIGGGTCARCKSNMLGDFINKNNEEISYCLLSGAVEQHSFTVYDYSTDPAGPSYTLHYNEGDTFEDWVASANNVPFGGIQPDEYTDGKASISNDKIHWYGGKMLFKNSHAEGNEVNKTDSIDSTQIYIRNNQWS